MNFKELQNNTDLTENESRVLIYLYEFGSSSALEISHETNISKISVTYLLTKLIEKDLVEKRTRYNTHIFEARSPEQLVKREEDKIKRLQQKRSNLSTVVKKLKKIRNYEGKKSIVMFTEASEVNRLRVSLMDTYERGDMTRDMNRKTHIEIYENEKQTYLISADMSLACKFEPKSDFEKVSKIFKLFLTSELN